MKQFYIYVYIRPDTFAPFYVGKGVGPRALERKRSRNRFFRNIVNKLMCDGLQPVCCILRDDLSEIEAFASEIELIAQLRGQGFDLANATNGGEGVTGMKHSAETREVLRKYVIGKKQSAEVIAKRVAGRSGYQHSEETKAKIGSANYAGGRKIKVIVKKSAEERSAIARATWLNPVHRGSVLASRSTPEAKLKKQNAILAALTDPAIRAKSWITRRKNMRARSV